MTKERERPRQKEQMNQQNQQDQQDQPTHRGESTPQFADTDLYSPGSTPQSGPVREEPPIKKKNRKPLWLGITAAFLLATGIWFQAPSAIDMSQIHNGVAIEASAGTVVVANDQDSNVVPQDFTVTMKENQGESRVLIWDYAAEDGDVVTVTWNGQVIATDLPLMNNPTPLQIPGPGALKVIGVKDGGGGITYAVKFPGAVKDQVYFNAADVGSSNVYTITVLK